MSKARTNSQAVISGGVSSGGTTGQVLVKVDATDYNTKWVDPANTKGTMTRGKSIELNSTPLFL